MREILTSTAVIINSSSIPPNVWGELFKIALSQVPNVSFNGIPGIGFLSIPLVVGLVLGFFVKKALKITLIGLIIVSGGLYLGVLSMSDIQYYLEVGKGFGPEVMQYAAILFGMLPLGLGFFVGLLIGLKFG